MKGYFSKTFVKVFITLLTVSSALHAQSTTKPKPRIEPLWVKMMDDHATNYYKAIAEYEKFWKGKEKPADEEHLMNKGKEPVQEHIRKMSRREVNRQRDMDYYRYQCKRFENWVRVNKGYVQKDGHILTADERLKLWEQSKIGR